MMATSSDFAQRLKDHPLLNSKVGYLLKLQQGRFSSFVLFIAHLLITAVSQDTPEFARRMPQRVIRCSKRLEILPAAPGAWTLRAEQHLDQGGRRD